MIDHHYNPKHKHCSSCQEWKEYHTAETNETFNTYNPKPFHNEGW